MTDEKLDDPIERALTDLIVTAIRHYKGDLARSDTREATTVLRRAIRERTESFDIEAYIGELEYGDDTDEYARTLVAGNLRQLYRVLAP